MDARQQAVLVDFLLWALAGFVLAAVPVLETAMQAGPDRFDWRTFLWALLSALVTGLIGAIRKYVAPQLVGLGDMSLSPGARPTVIGVALKDVHPAPIKVGAIQQGAQPPPDRGGT
jgi:hypothetical protein